MDVLSRISTTFNNIKNTIKNKNSSDRLMSLKKEIQILNTELATYGKENHDQYVRSLAMEAYITLLSAKLMPLSLSDKRDVLIAIFEKLKQFQLREECLFIFLRVQNLLCYYLIQLDQVNMAKDILESMEDLYGRINKSEGDNFYDAEDLFTMDPLSKINRVNPEKIDKVITNNIQMQAFLYNKLNMPERYTLYNHTVLRRQLEMKEGTPQDWALKTARLGNYFTYLNQLGNARYHLAAAYHVLRTCHDNCKLMPEEFVLQKADFEMNFLELSHHWVKYGLSLFKLSKKKILNRYFSNAPIKTNLWQTVNTSGSGPETVVKVEKYDDDNAKDVGASKDGKGDCAVENHYIFPTLDLKELENRIPSEMITDIEAARRLFAFTHKWLMRAKHYYDFDNHAAQYISCSLQLAELYEHLAFFEKNIDNQYNIQKRRADVLEALNSLLKNCESVMSVQIDVIKELSQVQLELMALNLQKLWREESQTNMFNLDADADSIINSLDSESNKTLTERTLNTPSKNIYLRKMEAATLLSGKLFRLSGQLDEKTPSQLSFATDVFKNP